MSCDDATAPQPGPQSKTLPQKKNKSFTGELEELPILLICFMRVIERIQNYIEIIVSEEND